MFSKWPDMACMDSNVTTACTVAFLRNILSIYGLPGILVSYYGPQFISKEFKNL